MKKGGKDDYFFFGLLLTLVPLVTGSSRIFKKGTIMIGLME